jgi:hypothetical protein
MSLIETTPTHHQTPNTKLPVYEDQKTLIDSFVSRGYDFASFTGLLSAPTTAACSSFSPSSMNSMFIFLFLFLFYLLM